MGSKSPLLAGWPRPMRHLLVPGGQCTHPCDLALPTLQPCSCALAPCVLWPASPPGLSWPGLLSSRKGVPKSKEHKASSLGKRKR